MSANNEVAKLFASFEDCKFNHDGVEAWRARDLMVLLRYAAWQDFRNAVKRAWESCATVGLDPALNFLVGDGSAAWSPEQVFRGAPKNPQGGRPSEDVILTRRAAYLVAMNGDPRKPVVAFAQHYFAAKTRTLEVIEQRLTEAARLEAREKLTKTESKFQGVLYEHEVDGPGISRIRSQGDEVLFGGNDTEDMKEKWGCPKKRPLADFAPEVAIVAKQLATAMTTHNVKARNLKGEEPIGDEHVANNESVRAGLQARGIILETLEGGEDLKKVKRRHESEAKALTKDEKPKKPKKSETKKKAKKTVSVQSMVEWFRSNHERAVESSPHDNESDTGYAYPLADVRDVLEGEFHDASEAAIEAAERELDDDGPWIDSAFSDALEEDRRVEAAERHAERRD